MLGLRGFFSLHSSSTSVSSRTALMIRRDRLQANAQRKIDFFLTDFSERLKESIIKAQKIEQQSAKQLHDCASVLVELQKDLMCSHEGADVIKLQRQALIPFFKNYYAAFLEAEKFQAFESGALQEACKTLENTFVLFDRLDPDISVETLSFYADEALDMVIEDLEETPHLNPDSENLLAAYRYH